ncbi:MAG TPA: preprotein translocase subunit SecE [Pilimelia sp.]|nr:preprotein translocase subunit SecE [Pilimelia sp.]
MAEKNRRGEEPADNDLDDLFDDEAEPVDDGDAADEEPVSRRGGTATRERTKASADDRPGRERREAGRGGPFGFIGRFVREVVGELRKVIWPTRNELLTYTAVVVVFLTVMTAIVVGLDYVFAEVMLFVFGDPN